MKLINSIAFVLTMLISVAGVAATEFSKETQKILERIRENGTQNEKAFALKLVEDKINEEYFKSRMYLLNEYRAQIENGTQYEKDFALKLVEDKINEEYFKSRMYLLNEYRAQIENGTQYEKDFAIRFVNDEIDEECFKACMYLLNEYRKQIENGTQEEKNYALKLVDGKIDKAYFNKFFSENVHKKNHFSWAFTLKVPGFNENYMSVITRKSFNDIIVIYCYDIKDINVGGNMFKREDKKIDIMDFALFINSISMLKTLNEKFGVKIEAEHLDRVFSQGWWKNQDKERESFLQELFELCSNNKNLALDLIKNKNDKLKHSTNLLKIYLSQKKEAIKSYELRELEEGAINRMERDCETGEYGEMLKGLKSDEEMAKAKNSERCKEAEKIHALLLEHVKQASEIC